MDLLVADGNDYQDLVDNLLKEFNQLDGLLLNAGILEIEARLNNTM